MFAIFFSTANLFATEINQPVLSQTGFIENKGQIVDQNNLPNKAVKYLFHSN